MRCGETSAAGGFPSAGDWRTRREVPSVVATGVKVAFERRETQRVLDFVGFRLTQPNLQLYASLKRLSTQLGAIAPTVRKIDRASPPSTL
ncbi:hypothetical protein GS682_11620 [Nostoc sp. B(2019)]|nr:hypothetical protein [Nostoc sp. B(2019)]